jgi:hypothetical protein
LNNFNNPTILCLCPQVISVANWDLASLQNRSASLFRRITTDFLGTPTSTVPSRGGHMNVSALDVFNAGSAMQ